MMRPLVFEETDFTPSVIFDTEKNIFEISGNSRPEDLGTFYYPILLWWDDFLTDFGPNKDNLYSHINPLVINFKLEYFNSSTSKMLFDMIIKIKSIIQYGVDYVINWYYFSDDLDIYENAMQLSDEAFAPFNFIIIDRD